MIFSHLILGSDHAGFLLRQELRRALDGTPLRYQERGAFSEKEPIDYPEVVQEVVPHVLGGSGGVLICGSGVGMSIAANRFEGIRAALCDSPQIAQLSRRHNDANILVLGARFLTAETALECLKAFLETSFEGGRHLRRIQSLDQLKGGPLKSGKSL